METRCAAQGCDNNADAYGEGTLKAAFVTIANKRFRVEFWLCPKHAGVNHVNEIRK